MIFFFKQITEEKNLHKKLCSAHSSWNTVDNIQPQKIILLKNIT